jgi:hypothetical protein
MNENNVSTICGFMMTIVCLIILVISWGAPDLIDAMIYYLSDGHYKQD